MKTNIDNLNSGHYLSENQYYLVKNVSHSTTTVINENGAEYTIHSNIIANDCYNAHEYDKEVKLNREQMIYLIQQIGGDIFKVVFNKQMKPNEVKKAIKEALDSKPSIEINESQKDYEKKCKTHQKEQLELIENLLKGEERTLIGYKFTPQWTTTEELEEFLKVEKNTGRISMIDLTKPKEVKNGYDTRYVQLDLRTATEVIWRRIRFYYGTGKD